MVASSSTAAQAAENEKRKKQTMEKVKVNHLSRQLQMRLQYARLKVEHGWQKQNLNEVENLYFHNSHLRGPKQYPVPTIVPAQSQSSTFPPPQLSFAQSRLSFRFGSTPIRNSTLAELATGNDSNNSYISQGESNFNHATQHDTFADFSNSTTITAVSPGLNVPDEPSVTTNPDLPQLKPSISPSGNLGATGLNEDATKPPEDRMIINREHTASPQDDKSPTEPLHNPTNHYPSVKYARPRLNKAQPNSRSQLSLTAKDMYNFGSSSTLTYDSFWSTHSGSNTPRSARGPVGTAPLEYQPSFQIPGDFTSGIQEPSRSSSTSIFSSSSNFSATPVYIENGRNSGGPT